MLRRSLIAMLALVALAAGGPSRAEVVEEIVAWVNGSIITRSELLNQERLAVAAAVRENPDQSREETIAQVRSFVLPRMLDDRILLDRARDVFNLEAMGENLYQNFKAQQGFESDQEFLDWLSSEGFTQESFREQLLSIQAPQQLIRVEVQSRISVSDRQIDAYYQEHQDEFIVAGTVDLREIVLLADSAQKRTERLAEAEAIIERARTEDFAALATELSEVGTKSKGGLIEGLVRTDVAETLREAAFGLDVGGVSAPLERPYGWHILKVVARTEDGPEDESVSREKIRVQLMNERYGAERDRYMAKARQEAEWCVKEKYRPRLPFESADCRAL